MRLRSRDVRARPRSRDPGRLLLVFTHPDDESFFTAGTVARHVAGGGEALVVSATRGERGSQPSVPVCPPSELGRVRARELGAACRIMGARGPVFLGYPDRALAEADAGEAVARIGRIMARFRPDAVVTFGPDGIYGHPDHVAIHALTLRAYDRVLGRTDREAGGREPRLWYAALPSAVWRYRPHDWTAAARQEGPGPGPEGGASPPRGRLAAEQGLPATAPVRIPVSPGQPEAAIDISSTLETKMAALLSHRTQRHNVERAYGGLYDFERGAPTGPEAAAVLSREYFTLARGPRPSFVLEESLLEPGEQGKGRGRP